MSEFKVLCRVTGGVTGTRESFLKSNGKVKTFATREEAQAEATRLNRLTAHTAAPVFFSYTVHEETSR